MLILTFMIPISSATNYEKNYSFQFQYGLLSQKMYVSIQPSLYNYYNNLSHTINCETDYARFVTPLAVEPIAERIQEVTNTLPYSEERFADAVLTLVHQIPYVVTGVKYPVETLVNNSGDCVGLSLLAASIMKAGGLEVVLISYTGINPGHVNVGVYLPHTPVYHNILTPPTGFDYNNKTYWTAEATPETDWKVGDQSQMLVNTKSVITQLESSENSTPGEISASLGSQLLSSSITGDLSQKPTSIQNTSRGFIISGSISPVMAGQKVTVYCKNSSCSSYFETVTDIDGNYALGWNFASAGTYYITTSWSGAYNYEGDDSETLTVFVGPESFVQFQTPEYNYILTQTNLAYYLFGSAVILPHIIRPLQGVDNFLSIPLSTNISFSYDFIIMPTGHTASNISSQTITIPARQETIRIGRNRPIQTIKIPEETLTVPTEVPPNMQPLTLPDDINQTINNQFCFLLQDNGPNNCSLDMRALNSYDISNITEGNAVNPAFLNASETIEANNWYTITERISENQVITEINNRNGTLIENVATPYNLANNKILILVANNVNSAVIMKNLRIQNLSNAIVMPNSDEKTKDGNNCFETYVTLTTVLFLVLVSTILYFKNKRQNDSPLQIFRQMYES